MIVMIMMYAISGDLFEIMFKVVTCLGIIKRIIPVL
jgi:hypothetical protein